MTLQSPLSPDPASPTLQPRAELTSAFSGHGDPRFPDFPVERAYGASTSGPPTDRTRPDTGCRRNPDAQHRQQRNTRDAARYGATA